MNEILISTFAFQAHISKLCPNKKKQIDELQILYQLNHLTVLHRQFEIETKVDVDYHIFLRYVPSLLVKPKVDD